MPEKALTCSGEIPKESGFKKVGAELEWNTCKMQYKRIFKRGRLESFETS
jgi:hypothetical protein